MNRTKRAQRTQLQRLRDFFPNRPDVFYTTDAVAEAFPALDDTQIHRALAAFQKKIPILLPGRLSSGEVTGWIFNPADPRWSEAEFRYHTKRKAQATARINQLANAFDNVKQLIAMSELVA